MMQVIWDTRGYLFWLLVVSVFCLILERIWPWRRKQKLLRRQFAQDLFWLFFNGHYLGILVAYVAALLFAWAIPAIDKAKSLHLLAEQPFWIQFVVFFLAKDFMEWGIHILPVAYAMRSQQPLIGTERSPPQAMSLTREVSLSLYAVWPGGERLSSRSSTRRSDRINRNEVVPHVHCNLCIRSADSVHTAGRDLPERCGCRLVCRDGRPSPTDFYRLSVGAAVF